MAATDVTPWICTDDTPPTGHFKSMKDGTVYPFSPVTSGGAPGSTVWGVYPGNEGTETNAQAMARWTSEIGLAPQVARAYDNSQWIPGVQSAVTAYGIGLRPVVVSFEQNSSHSMADIAAGVYDTDIINWLIWLSANRAGHTVYFVFGHEFDVKVHNGTYPFTGTGGWLPAWLHVESLVLAHGDAGIVTNVIWSGFSFTGPGTIVTGGRFEPAWSGGISGHCQVIGLDPYQNIAGSGSVLASDVFDPLLNEISTFAGSAALARVGIAEAGWRSAGSSSSSPNQLAYLESIGPYGQGVFEYFCWFDVLKSGINNHMDSVSGAPAAYEAIMAAAA